MRPCVYGCNSAGVKVRSSTRPEHPFGGFRRCSPIFPGLRGQHACWPWNPFPCRSKNMRNFLIGLGLGVAAGTMIAPSSGDETRERLRRKTEEILDGVRGRANQLRQRAGMLGDVVQSIRSPQRGAENERSSRSEAAASRAEEPESGSGTRLNTISREALLEVYGIGPVLADKIIQNRPYGRAHEVVERGILPQSTFENLRQALGRKSA